MTWSLAPARARSAWAGRARAGGASRWRVAAGAGSRAGAGDPWCGGRGREPRRRRRPLVWRRPTPGAPPPLGPSTRPRPQGQRCAAHVQRPSFSRSPCSVSPSTSAGSVVRSHPTDSTVGSLLPVCASERGAGRGGGALRRRARGGPRAEAAGAQQGSAGPRRAPRPARRPHPDARVHLLPQPQPHPIAALSSEPHLRQELRHNPSAVLPRPAALQPPQAQRPAPSGNPRAPWPPPAPPAPGTATQTPASPPPCRRQPRPGVKAGGWRGQG
jgi:hypothetical protein